MYVLPIIHSMFIRIFSDIAIDLEISFTQHQRYVRLRNAIFLLNVTIMISKVDNTLESENIFLNISFRENQISGSLKVNIILTL